MRAHQDRIVRAIVAVLAAVVFVVPPDVTHAQKSVADILGRPQTAEGAPKPLLEELSLYGYIENSFVHNLRTTGRNDLNELRFYDLDNGYTFNAAELSLRKDPSEAHRLGFGVVVTGGSDSQKNHSLGIFRDRDDQAPFRNTARVDLPEAYAAYLVPLGDGLTIKAGKWATLIGYEVYESPKNLNFSRSFLYVSTPYTHTGLLVTYPLTKWLSVTAGFTNGWDSADSNNGYLRPIGSFALTPSDKLSFTTNWLVGPEQNRDQMRGHDVNRRWVVDNTLLYTGVDKLTLALNFDFAGEENEPALVAAKGRPHNSASWGGVAGYVAYDWTKALRSAFRAEYFADPQSVRTGVLAPGQDLELWEVTLTAEYKIWRGLVGRLEYRHDDANRKVFSVQNRPGGPAPTSAQQDTLSLDLYYLFF